LAWRGYALLGHDAAQASRRLRTLQLAGITIGKATKATKPFALEREYAALFEPLRDFREALAACIPAGDDAVATDAATACSDAERSATTAIEKISVVPTTTLLAVKQVVEARMGVPTASQLLICGYKAMDLGNDSRTLADLGITAYAPLRMRPLRRGTHMLLFATISQYMRLAAEVLPDATVADVQAALSQQEQRAYHCADRPCIWATTCCRLETSSAITASETRMS